MTTHDAYLSATVADNEVTIRNQTAAIAAKDTEIASLRTRLEASAQEVAPLQLNNNATIYYRNLLDVDATEIRNLRDCLAGRNKRVAELVNEVLELRKQPSCAQLNEELRTTHAAHRAAVVRWSDAEAEVKEYAKALNIMHQQAAFGSPSQHLITEQEKEIRLLKHRNEQQAESIRSYRRENEAFKNSDQTAEIRRLKTRLNQLIATVHHAGSVFRAWVPENL